MYVQAGKIKENKSMAAANPVVRKKNNVKQGYGFVDNRKKSIKLSNDSILQLAPIEVEKAIHETITGSFAADDGIAFLYIENKLKSHSIVPRPKPKIKDDFMTDSEGKDKKITINDGENYLLHGVNEKVIEEGKALKERVEKTRNNKEVERINEWTKEPYKVTISEVVPEEFNIDVEVVGSAGACDHCKTRLSGFKAQAGKYQQNLKSNNFVTKDSVVDIDYHYTTRNKQTGPGPGGKYGWDDATEEKGKIGKHVKSDDEKEYTWWKKSI
ncbi:MAG: hypothetical protein KJP07_19830 [Desulfatitalea sp.]|nr:hypothetical protein [Desulfatitalea sp.]